MIGSSACFRRRGHGYPRTTWISTHNIDRGAIWFNEIQNQLQNTTVGIICLTQDNRTKPWILFEAGALAKGLSGSRVCTFLVDLDPADVENPLAQFNHTLPNREGMWALVLTLNSALPAEHVLEERILEKVFQTYWPRFEQDFARVLAENPQGVVAPQREDKDILAEILENTRSLGARVGKLEIGAQVKMPTGNDLAKFSKFLRLHETARNPDKILFTDKQYSDLVNSLRNFSPPDKDADFPKDDS